MNTFSELIARSLVAGTMILAPIICLGQDKALETASETEAEQVVVTGSSQPALISYRDMLAGLDAFDEQHDLAPAAVEVRFSLKPQKDKDATLDGLTLRIVGDTVVIPVALTKEASFTVPRNNVADDENADMVLSKNKNDYSLEIAVRSVGVPEGTRRLGDLRMECQVGVAMAKKEIGFFWKATINTILLSSDWCMSDKVDVPSYMREWITSATLIDGDRRIALKVEKGHHSFQAPINKKIYSNDDLIELQFGTGAEVEADSKTDDSTVAKEEHVVH